VYAPPVRYYEPAPVYYSAPPAYYYPRPVYYAAPVYYGPRVVTYGHRRHHHRWH
jgi:hypothetical protein